MQANTSGITFLRHREFWLSAPGERHPDFFPAFARVSVALQQALRERVPAAYFQDPESYQDTKKAYPMLVYRASRPFRARMRTELTYDVLNPATLARVFRSAKQCLPEILAAAEEWLVTAGLPELARSYQTRRAVEIVESVQRLSKSRRYLYVLIRSESALMNALIDLGGLGSLGPKEQSRRIAAFEKRWTFELRRLYPGMDCLALGPHLLDAASRAWIEFRDRASSVDALQVDDGSESALE